MNNKFTVIRDSREKEGQGWVFDEDERCEGTIIQKLDAGDYAIEGLEDFFCIERKKSVDEFANNCPQARWTKCMERMKNVKHAYIVFEFPFEDINRYPHSSRAPYYVKQKLRLGGKYLRRQIYKARHDYDIHVLACRNSAHAEEVAYKLINKAYDLQYRRS